MPQTPLVVFVHVHYPDIWQEMSRLLARRLTQPFDLVLTSPHPRASLAVPSTPALRRTTFIPVENRGRDILPFLTALAATPDFEFGLKLHTKKSPQRLDGAEWRGAVLDSLLPAGRALPRLLRRFRAEPRAGLVAPAGFALSVKPWILVNAPFMHAIMQARGATLDEDDLTDAFFAAGSMFWFRRSALAALADPRVMALFEPESGQLDGTAAHAMERLFAVEVRRQGYVTLATPALAAVRPGAALPHMLAVARRHADLPSTYFPAPYVAERPPVPPRGQRVRAWLRGQMQRLRPMRVARSLRRRIRLGR